MNLRFVEAYYGVATLQSVSRAVEKLFKGLTQREVSWIACTALPLFVLMAAVVLTTWFAPEVVLWLPRQMLG